MRPTALAAAALRAARASGTVAAASSCLPLLRCCSPLTASALTARARSSSTAPPPPSDANKGQHHHPPLAPGARLERRASFSLADVSRFTALTGDANPLHTETAATPIVPGLLLASLFPAIIGTAFPGALYLKQSLSFRRSGGSSRVLFETVCRCAGTGAVLVDGTALARIAPAVGVGGAGDGGGGGG